MAMVEVDVGPAGGLTAQVGWLGLKVGGRLALPYISQDEPGELSQWLCHDYSIINIVRVLLVYYYYYYYYY